MNIIKLAKKAVAFTLAETLVVMGIIGVVAALTIPNLNQSTGDREKVAKVKKIYANLEDAFGRAVAVYGPYEEWFNNDTTDTQRTERVAGRLIEFLKVSKDCGLGGEGCFPSEYYTEGSNTPASLSDDKYYLTLADGTALQISAYLNAEEDGGDLSFNISADIDGLKGSNTRGKDIFGFGYTELRGTFEPNCNSGDLCSKPSSLANFCFKRGTCTGWVIENGNLDYLEADDDGVCPNGTQLSWENTSCK